MLLQSSSLLFLLVLAATCASESNAKDGVTSQPEQLRKDVELVFQRKQYSPHHLMLPRYTDEATALAQKYSSAELAAYAADCDRKHSKFCALALCRHAGHVAVQDLAISSYFGELEENERVGFVPYPLLVLSHAPDEVVRVRTEAMLRKVLESEPHARNKFRFKTLCQLLAIVGDDSTQSVLDELAAEWRRQFPGRGFGGPIASDVRYESHLLKQKLLQPEGELRKQWLEYELLFYRLQFELRPLVTQEMAWGDLALRTVNSGIVFPEEFLKSKLNDPQIAPPLAIVLTGAYGYESLCEELIDIVANTRNILAVDALAGMETRKAKQGLLTSIRPDWIGNKDLARALARVGDETDREKLRAISGDLRFSQSDRDYFRKLLDRHEAR